MPTLASSLNAKILKTVIMLEKDSSGANSNVLMNPSITIGNSISLYLQVGEHGVLNHVYIVLANRNDKGINVCVGMHPGRIKI